MIRNFFVFLALLGTVAQADPVAPNCTPAEEDATLFGGQTARAFFAARQADANCQNRYGTAKTAYDSARAELKKLVASGANAAQLDAQEAKVEAARTPYLTALAECGPCAARPVSAPVEINGGDRPQVWYTTDGSCQLPTTDRAELSKVFERMSDTLSRTSKYARNAKDQTGFHPILALYAIDSAGRQNPSVDKIPADRATQVFMSIAGPLSTAFSYFFDATTKITEVGGVKQYTLHQEGINPDGVRPPRTITYLSAGGKKKVAISTQLAHANGQWYVNEDGYLRYCTSADFGLRSQFVESFGRTILLDILSTAVEKAQE